LKVRLKCWHQQPETLSRRCGDARLAGAGRAIGRQLRDDLPGYHQPFQLVLGVGELLAQQLDLAGQLGRPPGDPFR
jgi:hypothetical protein